MFPMYQIFIAIFSTLFCCFSYRKSSIRQRDNGIFDDVMIALPILSDKASFRCLEWNVSSG